MTEKKILTSERHGFLESLLNTNNLLSLEFTPPQKVSKERREMPR